MTAVPKTLIGHYVGKTKIREGKEDVLTPVERKRIEKSREEIPLRLNQDGTFTHKKTTAGRFQVLGNRLVLSPEIFNGATLKAMKEQAAASGRDFGLAWLFDPFELTIAGEKLIFGTSDAVIYTEYMPSQA